MGTANDSARSRAYAEALSVVSNLRFSSDRFIREDDIAKAIGVSRTPVREAFHRLEAEGLIQLEPRKGAYVPVMSIREVHELLECRQLFEVQGAKGIIESHKVSEIERLRELVALQLAELGHEQSQERLFRLDQEFHDSIVVGSGNSVIVKSYRALRNRQLRLMLTVTAGRGNERWAHAVDEHDEVVRCMEHLDLPGARDAIQAHCGRTAASAGLAISWPEPDTHSHHRIPS